MCERERERVRESEYEAGDKVTGKKPGKNEI